MRELISVMHKQHSNDSIATINLHGSAISAHITTGEYVAHYITSLFQKVTLGIYYIANALLSVS